MDPEAKVISSLDREAGDLYALAQNAHKLAVEHSWATQKPDGHWNGELTSNVTITAEQIFFLQSLGMNPIPDSEAYRHYLLSEQQPDGSWSIAPDYPGDVSTSAEAYFALKLLGVAPEHEAMRRGRAFIRRCGGVASVRIFTRMFFAQFGLFPWSAVPQLPAEFIFCPSFLPTSVYRLASWARSTVIPLLIIRHHEKVYPLPESGGRPDPRSTYLDELWLNPGNKQVPYGPNLLKPWECDPWSLMFVAIDTAIYWLGGLRPFWPVRKYARRKCVQWILERQEKQGDWAGIIQPMHAGVQALLLEGYGLQDERIQSAIAALERFTWKDGGGKRLQPCVSPVWDTALMTRGLCDGPTGIPTVVFRGRGGQAAGEEEGGPRCDDDERLRQAVRWLQNRQQLGPEGDWRVYNPALEAGGFSFEYNNTWYPDVDDTAAVILALLHQDPAAADSATVARAAGWICGMQNRDGGWGAFDMNNDYLWLNRIPFSDMDALCDPSTADVTAHVLEAFGLLQRLLAAQQQQQQKGDAPPPPLPVVQKRRREAGPLQDRIGRASARGVAYILGQQEPSGAWYGRWGANYVYGTSQVLCGLEYYLPAGAGASSSDEEVEDAVRAGAGWLERVQNEDGGWGDDLLSYHDPARAGRGPSTPSQTAWALMGLLAVHEGRQPQKQQQQQQQGPSPAIESGIAHLVETQVYSSSSGGGGGGGGPERSSEGEKDKNKKKKQSTASWPETRYTGTGFPKFFYIGYTLYRHYFPIMALGRYLCTFQKAGADEKITIDTNTDGLMPLLEKEVLESPVDDSGYSDHSASGEHKTDLDCD